MPRGNPLPWFRPSRNTWYVTIDGVQHNLKTADKDEAYENWHALMASGPSEADKGPQTPLVDMLAVFAEWCQKHRSEGTYNWYRQFLEDFAKSIPRGLAVEDLKPFHVTRWLDKHPNWASSTRRGAVTALKRALQWAVDEGYFDQSPIARLPKPRAERRETILSNEQRALIVSEASDREFKDFLTLLTETGARPQELRSLEKRHVDLKNGLWVFPAKENKTGEKTGKPRVVYLTPKALAITQRLMERNKNGPLLRNSEGKPWTRNAIRCRFRRLRERLNDKLPDDLCAYAFRHTFATDALERGVDPITVAELMGHKDATMVSRVYQHIDRRADHLKAAAKRATSNGNASGQE